MNITYYGHSCFGVEINGKHLLFDPFISPNKLAKNINVDAVKADYILVSHGHEDHIGGIPFLLQVVKIPKIYAPRFAKGLLSVRLKFTHG